MYLKQKYFVSKEECENHWVQETQRDVLGDMKPCGLTWWDFEPRPRPFWRYLGRSYHAHALVRGFHLPRTTATILSTVLRKDWFTHVQKQIRMDGRGRSKCSNCSNRLNAISRFFLRTRALESWCQIQMDSEALTKVRKSVHPFGFLTSVETIFPYRRRERGRGS